MGELLDFPTQQAQGLAYLDRHLRKLLGDRGADDELIDFAANSLNRIYSRLVDSEDYSFTVQLPAGLEAGDRGAIEQQINAGLESIREGNHALMLDLVAQLVLAEVKLFQQQRE